MRAYRTRIAYVHARFELGGVELDGIALDDMDSSDMHGYADRFRVPVVEWDFMVAGTGVDETFSVHARTREHTLHASRVEGHRNPTWLEPYDKFMGAG